MVTDIDSSDDRIEEWEMMCLYQRKGLNPLYGIILDCNGHPHCVNSPKCHLCQTTIAAKDSNTFNLYSHLKSKHLEEYLLAQRAS